MSKNITVNYANEPCYQIVIEHDFSKLNQNLLESGFSKGRKICIVADETVASLHLSTLTGELSKEFSNVILFTFPAGEENKTLATVQKVYEYLIENKFDRSDLLIAFGGGVVGDLTGYTAATYLRGISFVQIPTTLLSQVDSSIGGKTGVDFLSYKNMVGAFHMPSLVYMNLDLLNTLPKEQYICGLGEIVKHGLIMSREYYDWLLLHKNHIMDRSLPDIEEMVYQSCLIKKGVVERDPKERGERALLNFGHTIGHAVEKLSDFSLYHGQCVAIGMRSALFLSHRYGSLPEESFQNAIQALDQFEFPSIVKNMTAEEVLFVSKSDKKMEQGKIKFILIRQPGEAYIESELTDSQLLEAIQFILEEV